MGNLHAAGYGLILGDCVPLPSFSSYSYWYVMISLDAYSKVQWLEHGYHTRNAWLRLWCLYIEMNSLLQHGNTRWYTQFIIRLVHMNIFIVSTCEYTFVVTHWIHSKLIACYVLVDGNDVVINTHEIQQIHVTFYLVSTYKWRGCY